MNSEHNKKSPLVFFNYYNTKGEKQKERRNTYERK
nr:MAG TPA: hypothetical protein [Caudoviricetes sp.]